MFEEKKKTMGEKWPVSQQPSPTIPPLAPPLFMLRQRMGPPSLPETGVKGQHGPLDISYDNTSGCVLRMCVCVCVWGGVFLHEKDRAKHAEWWERWEVKSLQDWKAQIIRSACRSSVLKSIYTIHALGCQVHAALCCPRTSSFKISIIKDCTLSGN